MSNPNLLDINVRMRVIADIKSSENRARKMAEQRKFDIYRKRQAGYVLERLQDEFTALTVQGMRKVLSINPCKRIVDEQASLYVDEPERHLTETTEATTKQVEDLYKAGCINAQMRLANRFYKLHGQSTLYCLPRDGAIMARALTPKDFDVIPDADDPEKAFAYVLNVMDRKLAQTAPSAGTATRSETGYSQDDGRNQIIADANDSKAKAERYVVWTDELHFTCNGKGEIVSEAFAGNAELAPMAAQPNPIGRLPFVDIANEKDFEFFVRLGSDVAEFVIDFLTQLSDLANTCRFQNYSQAIVYSASEPTSLNVGPNKVIWLKIDPNNPQAAPKFAFESPSPDIVGTLEFLNVQLKMFLSSVGLNPGTVSGKNEVEKFTSGVDHLLANLDKFKASKEDMDVFKKAEYELFEIIRAWHDVMFDVTGEGELNEELRQARISESSEIQIVYKEPTAVQTDSEVETYCVTAVKEGLMTRHEAVKRMYKVDDARADEIVAELDAEAEVKMKKAQEAMAKGIGPDGKPMPVVDPADAEGGKDGKGIPAKGKADDQDPTVAAGG